MAELKRSAIDMAHFEDLSEYAYARRVYPKSWAPASGRIVLAEVVRADINDDLPIPALTLVSKSGDTQKVLLAGYGHALYQHLSVRYPEIKISYVPPTSTG